MRRPSSAPPPCCTPIHSSSTSFLPNLELFLSLQVAATAKIEAAPTPPSAAGDGVGSNHPGDAQAAGGIKEHKGALGHNIPAGVRAAAGTGTGSGSGSGSGRKGGGVSWADRLRNFQIDVPAASYDLTSDRGGGAGGGGEGAQGGAGAVVDGGSASTWDGEGVDAATVIKHRRRFDTRCSAYEVCVLCVLVLLAVVLLLPFYLANRTTAVT